MKLFRLNWKMFGKFLNSNNNINNKMNFFNKWYIIIWIVILIVLSYFFIIPLTLICSDPYIDERKLIEKCNVTYQEYIQQIAINNSFCPEADEFNIVVKSQCDLDLIFFSLFIIFTSVIYNIIYAVFYFIIKKIKLKK